MMLRSSLRSAYVLPTAVRAFAAAPKSSSPAHAKGAVAPRPSWAKDLPTLGHILDAQISRKRTHRDYVRVCDQDERWTFEETKTFADAMGNGLHANRVAPGRRTAFLTGSTVETITGLFGASKAGVISSWLNPFISEEELSAVIKSLKHRGLILTPELGGVNILERLYKAIPDLEDQQLGEAIRCKGFRELKTVCHTYRECHPGIGSILDILLYDPMPDPLPDLAKTLSADSLATEHVDATGKAVQFSHNQVIDSAFSFASAAELGEDRVCLGVDLWTGAGHTATVACAVSDSLVIVPSCTFNADRLIREAARERASIIVTTPSRAAAALESSRLSREDLTSLRTVVLVGTAGDVAGESLIKKVQNGFEVANVLVGFADQESATPFLLSTADASAPGSVGRAVPNTEVQIVDQSGKPVSHGEVGSLVSRGAHACQSSAKSNGGWVSTGASARMDEKGNVFLA